MSKWCILLSFKVRAGDTHSGAVSVPLYTESHRSGRDPLDNYRVPMALNPEPWRGGVIRLRAGMGSKAGELYSSTQHTSSLE